MIKKRFASGMLVLTMIAGMLSGTAITVPAATGDVKINATNFPDKNFRKYIKENLDKNSNGVLSKKEIESVTELQVGSKNISDMTGVNKFYNLETLGCHYNELKSLNVSKLTKLKKLDCGNNKLSSLNISNNTKLKELSCYSNSLSSLNVSKNTQLEILDCSMNNISSLNVSKHTKLKELICYINNLSSLNVSKNTKLTKLYCSENNLKNLDVSTLSELDVLDCGTNNLSNLDVSKNKKLTYLHCQKTNLSSLDLSNNTKLDDLHCSNNNLSSLNLSNNPDIFYLNCSYNDLSCLDISNLPELSFLFCSNNKLRSLDVSKNTQLWSIDCSYNNLSCLDVSNLTELEDLDCSNNQLSCLDVSNLPYLNWLACESNICTVPLDDNRQFDLSTLDGFDVTKASNWDGGTVSGTTLTFTDNAVTYTYDVGLNEDDADPIVFTLKEQCKHESDFVQKTEKASFTKDGAVKMVCSNCEETMEILSTINKMKTPTLSKTSYIYDGKAKKPSVTVKDSAGTTLTKDTDYTVSYASGRTKVGSYKVTIKGKGNYTGSKTLTFKILPPGTSISKLTAGSKAFTAKWSKKTTQTTGYQIQYSLNKDFSNAKSVTVTKNSTTSKKISNLKAGKKYYVRVRTYKKVNSTKFYSSWSNAKTVTTKK